ncbi:MAG: hypothetical protein N2606_06100 [Candidatus Omnitrophica bacterium]|nr:hypothetical protein [Candidatus Omnitrophota bacterium]
MSRKRVITICLFFILSYFSLGSFYTYPNQTQNKSKVKERFLWFSLKKDKKDAPNLWHNINLSLEQKAALDKQRQITQQKKENLIQLLKEKYEQLNLELKNTKLDKRKMQAFSSDIKRIHGQITDLRLQILLFVKDTLNKEQFSLFMANLERYSLTNPKKTKISPSSGKEFTPAFCLIPLLELPIEELL